MLGTNSKEVIELVIGSPEASTADKLPGRSQKVLTSFGTLTVSSRICSAAVVGTRIVNEGLS